MDDDLNKTINASRSTERPIIAVSIDALRARFVEHYGFEPVCHGRRPRNPLEFSINPTHSTETHT